MTKMNFQSLADIIVNDVTTVRSRGIPKGLIKPNRSYKDGRGYDVKVTGYSYESGGFVGIDKYGNARIYNSEGKCIERHDGVKVSDKDILLNLK